VRFLFALAVAFPPDHAHVDQAPDVRDVNPHAPGDVLDRELHRLPSPRPVNADLFGSIR
jgi:hypothetical protein